MTPFATILTSRGCAMQSMKISIIVNDSHDETYHLATGLTDCDSRNGTGNQCIRNGH